MRFFLLLFLLAAAGSPIRAGIQLETEALSGPAWKAQGVALALEQGADGRGELRIRIERLTLAALPPPLQGISLDCAEFILNAERIRCSAGRLRVADLQGRPAQGRISFHYPRAGGPIEWVVSDFALAQGELAVSGTVSARDWRIAPSGVGLEAAALSALGQAAAGWPLDQGPQSGRLRLNATLSGQGGELRRAEFQLAGSGLSVAAGGGHYAAQELSLDLKGEWQSAGRFSAALTASQGRIYFHPMMIELSSAPLTAVLEGRSQDRRLELTRLSLSQPGVLQVQGGLTAELGQHPELRTLDITVAEAVFPQAYSAYIQPWLATTALGELTTAGRVRGRLALSREAVQALDMELTGLSLEDNRQRFGIQDLNGRLAWASDAAVRRSEMGWQRGHLYRLASGPARLVMETQRDAFRLAEPARIPLFDGALVVHSLAGRGLGTIDLRWQLDGLLAPVSLEALSRALGWPALAGKLSGTIPKVRYAEERLEVGGDLAIRIFGGTIAISQLRIDQLLSAVPRVSAELALRGLDLLALTQAFDFGSIEGTLEGSVRDLVLENWQPIRFDAAFATPEADKARHRISQRAVENISALGGKGATAALSRGFLGMFEAFGYRRLGLSCRLADGVCAMGGVGPAPGDGYYLVQGQGVPRIDVIGYHPQVDWHELLARLKAAIHSGKPVVK